MASNKANERKKLLALGWIMLSAALVSFAALYGGYFDRIENTLWDRRLRTVAAFSNPDPRIKIITIDQSSLDFFAREEKIYWPWPRALYEPVIKFLGAAGAKAVAFDILFTEPSSYGVEDDEQFGAALLEGPPAVVATALRSLVKASGDEETLALVKQLSERQKLAAKDYFLNRANLEVFGSALTPVPQILRGASALGNVSAAPDFDGIFRHATAGGIINGLAIPSLPFALFDLVNPHDFSPSHTTELLKQDGRLAVRFSGGARTYSTRPIAAVIQSYSMIEAGRTPTIDPSEYKDAIVFIGMDAPGLLDLRPTPLSEVFPGVEFNATVVDNLMHSSFFTKTSHSQGAALSTLLAFLLGLSALYAGRLRLQILALVFFSALFVASCFQTAISGIWLPMAVPLAIGAATVIFCFGFLFRLEGRQHRFLRHAFRHYVSGDVIDQIVENPASLAIGGEKRELTIFFSDIEGFTKISEKLEVSTLVTLLNSFFTEMSGIIMASGGTVDKYVGDAIVAFWNAPVEHADHAVQGVRAAMRCQQRLSELRAGYEEKFGVTVRFRVGMHTGVVNVGNFGSSDRFNYTMIGDAANLASRLEGVNKYFGTFILVSEATKIAVGDAIKMRRVAEVLVVGKKQSTVVYEPVTNQTAEDLERFEQGRAAFEAGRLEEAAAIFAGLPNDPVVKRYNEKISEHRVKDGEFTAVFVLAEK